MNEAPNACPRVAPKWRPRLGLIVFVALGVVLSLPLAGVFFFRIYENHLVRETEAELIAQCAVLAAIFKRDVETAAVPDSLLETLSRPTWRRGMSQFGRFGRALILPLTICYRADPRRCRRRRLRTPLSLRLARGCNPSRERPSARRSWAFVCLIRAASSSAARRKSELLARACRGSRRGFAGTLARGPAPARLQTSPAAALFDKPGHGPAHLHRGARHRARSCHGRRLSLSHAQQCVQELI